MSLDIYEAPIHKTIIPSCNQQIFPRFMMSLTQHQNFHSCYKFSSNSLLSQYFKYFFLNPNKLHVFNLIFLILSFTLFVRYCMFNQYRIPKSFLLSKIGSVNEEGQYVSPIKDPRKRFGLFFFSVHALCVVCGEEDGVFTRLLLYLGF